MLECDKPLKSPVYFINDDLIQRGVYYGREVESGDVMVEVTLRSPTTLSGWITNTYLVDPSLAFEFRCDAEEHATKLGLKFISINA